MDSEEKEHESNKNTTEIFTKNLNNYETQNTKKRSGLFDRK